MDWSSLISGLVGVVAGGGLTWALTRQQWKRDRRTRVLEEFYVQASRYVIAFDPIMDSPRPPIYLPELRAALTVMAIYVPREVVASAESLLDLLAADQDESYPIGVWDSNDMAAVYPAYLTALSGFESEMRKALGLRGRTSGAAPVAIES